MNSAARKQLDALAVSQFNDTAALTYDSESAVHFIAQKTEIDVEVVWRFMIAKDRYDVGMEIWGRDADYDGETPPAIRKLQPDLFPQEFIEERNLSTRLQREFVVRETNIAEEAIARMQDAEEAYMHARGLLVLVVVDE